MLDSVVVDTCVSVCALPGGLYGVRAYVAKPRKSDGVVTWRASWSLLGVTRLRSGRVAPVGVWSLRKAEREAERIASGLGLGFDVRSVKHGARYVKASGGTMRSKKVRVYAVQQVWSDRGFYIVSTGRVRGKPGVTAVWADRTIAPKLGERFATLPAPSEWVGLGLPEVRAVRAEVG